MKRWVWLIGSIALLLAGAFMILKPTVIDHMIINPYMVERAGGEMETVDAESIQENRARMALDDDYLVSAASDGTAEDSEMYDPAVVDGVGQIPLDATLDVDAMIGEIYMPRLGMHLPILEGITNENLWTGAGTMKPGQEMGKRNYALAGHHMWDADQLFTPLMDAKVGDVIYVTDKETVYVYHVDESFIAQPEDGHLVNDSEADGGNIITLVTCTDVWGTERYIVTGELVETRAVADMPADIQGKFRGTTK